MNLLKRRLDKTIVAVKDGILGLVDAIKKRIPSLEIKGLIILAVVLCLVIFAFGYWFGSINLGTNSSNSEKFKIIFPLIIPLVVGGLFTWLIDGYVRGNIDNKQKEYKQEIQNLQQKHEIEIRNLKLHMTQDSSYRKEQELEFLLYFQDYGKQLDNFDSTTFCNAVIELHKSGQLKKALDNYIKKVKARDGALEGLSKIFAEDENGKSVLQGLVGEACNHALNIQKSKTWADAFYRDIMLYLIWVYCGIKYGVNLNTKPFSVQESLGEEGIDLYRGKETYIETLKYIKEKSLKYKKIQRFFTTPDSIMTVDKYLDELIHILELE